LSWGDLPNGGCAGSLKLLSVSQALECEKTFNQKNEMERTCNINRREKCIVLDRKPKEKR
jgi:hypothetical protein